MSSAAPVRTPFRYAVRPGSREHVYALKRARWRAATEAWLANGRPPHFYVEGTAEAWDDRPGFLTETLAPRPPGTEALP